MKRAKESRWFLMAKWSYCLFGMSFFSPQATGLGVILRHLDERELRQLPLPELPATKGEDGKDT